MLQFCIFLHSFTFTQSYWYLLFFKLLEPIRKKFQTPELQKLTKLAYPEPKKASMFQGTVGCCLCWTYALLSIAYSRRSDSGVRCEVRGREERLEQAILPWVPEAFFSRASGCFSVGRRPADLPPTAEATSTETRQRAWNVSGTLQFTFLQISLRKQPIFHDPPLDSPRNDVLGSR